MCVSYAAGAGSCRTMKALRRQPARCGERPPHHAPSAFRTVPRAHVGTTGPSLAQALAPLCTHTSPPRPPPAHTLLPPLPPPTRTPFTRAADMRELTLFVPIPLSNGVLGRTKSSLFTRPLQRLQRQMPARATFVQPRLAMVLRVRRTGINGHLSSSPKPTISSARKMMLRRPKGGLLRSSALSWHSTTIASQPYVVTAELLPRFSVPARLTRMLPPYRRDPLARACFAQPMVRRMRNKASALR
jgi:hypothetical protein